jgi:hypothetical protein
MKNLFGYGCEFCSGTVKGKRVDREAFKHKAGFRDSRRSHDRRMQSMRKPLLHGRRPQARACDRVGEGQTDQDPTRTSRPGRVTPRTNICGCDSGAVNS